MATWEYIEDYTQYVEEVRSDSTIAPILKARLIKLYRAAIAAARELDRINNQLLEIEDAGAWGYDDITEEPEFENQLQMAV